MKKLIPVLLCLVFIITQSLAQQGITEDQKIEHLIRFIRNLKGATFIRNGNEHTANTAADHLQMKREKAGKRLKTAKEFIEKVASKSSISGEYYMIRFANGKEFPSQMVLTNELKKLEEGKSTLLK